MRRSVIVASAVLALGLGLAGPAWGDNPPGPPGPPGQSCQAVEPNTPGNAANSPGSPFNEPDIVEINYPYLFDLLDELGYAGWIGCEYRPKGETRAGLGWARRYGIGG